jgi:hypothetical protein
MGNGGLAASWIPQNCVSMESAASTGLIFGPMVRDAVQVMEITTYKPTAL